MLLQVSNKNDQLLCRHMLFWVRLPMVYPSAATSRQTDRQTDRRTDGRTDGRMGRDTDNTNMRRRRKRAPTKEI